MGGSGVRQLNDIAREEASGQYVSSPARLLPGVGEDDSLWEDLLPDFHGPVQLQRADGSSIKERARRVVETLSAPTLLVGHSMGGLIALRAAEIAPEACLCVVLISTGHPVEVNPKIYAALESDPPAAVAFLAAAAAGGKPGALDERQEEIAERFARMAGNRRPAALARDLRACEEFTPIPDPRRLAVPIVSVWGMTDRMIRPAAMQDLARRLGASEMPLEGVGHQIPWELPRAVIDACLSCEPSAEGTA
jgi:pimeloyl-ACP methyl ester carboxylesterase